MNNIVKGVLVFSVGAAVGAYVSYEVTMKKCEKIMEQEAEEWRKTMQENLQKKKEKIIADAEGIDELSSAVETPTKKKNRPRDNYKKIVNSLGYDGEIKKKQRAEEEEEKAEYSKLSRKEDSSRPYVITVEQYHEEMDHYDKLSISYYEDDDTLADEDEEIIHDVDKLVGEDSLLRFGEGSEDPEVVYVRNDALQIDYEIIRLSKSYKKVVLGFTD